MFVSILLILVGLAVLIKGADVLIVGAASISKKAGIPPLVVGLTVVAFGTSAPELVVNITAALNNSTDIAIGNILGSNIANILLILGVSALITNLKVQRSTTWKEVPFSFLAVLMVFVLGNDRWLGGGEQNMLSMGDGLVLLGFFVVFMYYIFGLSKNMPADDEVEEMAVHSYPKSLLFLVVGLIGLFLGGKVFVESAIDIARIAGISEMLIGLTVVAIGTSLPELFTSVMAAKRGQTDLAVGNVVGSCIFNIFWILGVTAIIHPVPLSGTVNFDILVALGSSFLIFIFLFFRNRHTLTKLHGAAFVVSYLAYLGYLIYRG